GLFAKCPFGGRLENLVRQPVAWPEVEAEAIARPDHQINPVDLGTILVPHDWLLLAGRPTGLIRAAPVSHAYAIPHPPLRAWVEGGTAVEIGVSLTANQRTVEELQLPLTSAGNRSVLHVMSRSQIAGASSGRKTFPR